MNGSHDANGATPIRSADQRAHERNPSLLMARLQLDNDEEGPQIVRIRNLSERGLMAEPGYPVTVGTVAVMMLPGIGEVRGAVAWSAEGRIGIALDEEIDPTLVVADNGIDGG